MSVGMLIAAGLAVLVSGSISGWAQDVAPARVSFTTPPSKYQDAPTTVSGTMSMPASRADKLPAVVILHSSGGVEHGFAVPCDEQPFSVCAQFSNPFCSARLLPQINRRCKGNRLALGLQLVKEDSPKLGVLTLWQIGKTYRFRVGAAKGDRPDDESDH